jgi:hypothetical protein
MNNTSAIGNKTLWKTISCNAEGLNKEDFIKLYLTK